MNNPNVLEIKKDGGLSFLSTPLTSGLSVNYAPGHYKGRGELTILSSSATNGSIHIPAQSIDIDGMPQLCTLRDLLDLAIEQHDAKHGVVSAVSEPDTAARDRELNRRAEGLAERLFRLTEENGTLAEELSKARQKITDVSHSNDVMYETIRGQGRKNHELEGQLAAAVQDAENGRTQFWALKQKLATAVKDAELSSRCSWLVEENERLGKQLFLANMGTEDERKISYILQKKLDETRAAYLRVVGVLP